MCKLCIIPKVTEATQDKVWKLAKALTTPMTRHDTHGFGYAALPRNLDAPFGEKWVNPKEAWNTIPRLNIPETELRKLQDFIYLKNESQEFGTKTRNINCLLLHARMATNAVCIDNTHPFLSKDKQTALIHNGIVDGTGKAQNYLTTCDSEKLLSAYCNYGIKFDVNLIQKLADDISGYYAVAAISSLKKKAYQILDIFKDDTAELVCAYIYDIESFVYCTKYSILQEACRKLKFKISLEFEVQDNKLIRYMYPLNEIVKIIEFEPNESFYGKYAGTSTYGYSEKVDDNTIKLLEKWKGE